MAHRPFVQERSSHRPARFAQRIKEELLTMIPGDLRDPAFEDVGFITITHVEITPDFRDGRVLFNLGLEDQPNFKKIEAALNKAAGFIKHELKSRMDTKVVPLLNFKYDKGTTNTNRIDELLKQVSATTPTTTEETASSNDDSDTQSDPDEQK
jgi:ribosome-binding factor A